MKIRTRLVLSFFISTLLPCLLLLLTLEVYMRVKGQGIADLFSGPDEDFFRDVGASIIIILSLTSLVLIIWIYGGLVSRIRMLSKAAKRIEEGDLDFSIESKGGDEIDDLAASFEEMRAHLKADSEKIVKLEDDRRQLLTNVTHDLKGPLTSISGYAEGLYDGVANTEEKKLRYLRTIMEKAKDMDSLLAQLSLFSKIDSDGLPYEFEHVKALDYVASVLRPAELDLKNVGGMVYFYTEVSGDLEIIVDKDKIRRVINNLIENAIKYRREDVPLALKVYLDEEESVVRFTVMDNGKGIPAKDIPHIFERSFRGDQSRNAKVPGSGFGLSIVKKLVNDHGGEVFASSIEGQGTTIGFTLKKYRNGV
ncbi:MAG: HAMP domain-containing histidine kinase [Lachnospiraceae bacterium]|nr:HAMP domain-containing histidine kinase [Lachnospiraceae bacterium]